MPTRALIAASLAFALIQLDVTVVNVALPAMGSALRISVAGLQWVVDAYTLAFAGLLLAAGALADRWGPVRTFIGGVVLFAATSAACAAAPGAGALIAARVLQGVGAAILMPSSLAIIRETFHEDKQRAGALGVWGATGGAATAAGPLVGGLLTAWLGWRSIFWVNLPLSVLAIALVLRAPRRPTTNARLPDAVSVFSSIACIASFAAWVIIAPQLHWSGIPADGLLAAAVAMGLCYVYSERRSARPLVPRRLQRSVPFLAALAGGVAVSFCMYGFLFVLSLYWQHVRGASAFQTGLAFLPITAQVVITSVLGARWVSARGSREPALCGFILAAAGYAGFLPLDAGSSFLAMIPALFAFGVGTALAVIALTTAVLSSTDRDLAATASGAFSAARQGGAALGVAVCGTLVSANGGFMPGMHRVAACAACLALLSAATIAAGLAAPRAASTPVKRPPECS